MPKTTAENCVEESIFLGHRNAGLKLKEEGKLGEARQSYNKALETIDLTAEDAGHNLVHIWQ